MKNSPHLCWTCRVQRVHGSNLHLILTYREKKETYQPQNFKDLYSKNKVISENVKLHMSIRRQFLS